MDRIVILVSLYFAGVVTESNALAQSEGPVEAAATASTEVHRHSEAHLLFGPGAMEGAGPALAVEWDAGVVPGRATGGMATIGGFGLEMRSGAALAPTDGRGSLFQCHYGYGVVVVPFPAGVLVPYASVGPSLAGNLDLATGGEAGGMSLGLDLTAMVGLDLLPGPHGRVGVTAQIELQQPVLTVFAVGAEMTTMLTAMVGLRLPAKINDGGRLARWSNRLPSF